MIFRTYSLPAFTNQEVSNRKVRTLASHQPASTPTAKNGGHNQHYHHCLRPGRGTFPVRTGVPQRDQRADDKLLRQCLFLFYLSIYISRKSLEKDYWNVNDLCAHIYAALGQRAQKEHEIPVIAITLRSKKEYVIESAGSPLQAPMRSRMRVMS